MTKVIEGKEGGLVQMKQGGDGVYWEGVGGRGVRDYKKTERIWWSFRGQREWEQRDWGVDEGCFLGS